MFSIELVHAIAIDPRYAHILIEIHRKSKSNYSLSHKKIPKMNANRKLLKNPHTNIKSQI